MKFGTFLTELCIHTITISFILIGVFIFIKLFKEMGFTNLNMLTIVKKKFLYIISPIKVKLISFKKNRLNISKNNDLKVFFSIVMITLVARLVVFFFAFLWQYFNKGTSDGFFVDFKGLWLKWDSTPYIFLAENGYVVEGEPRLYIVFYPLYPLLIRALNFITKNSMLSGVIISNVCNCFASYYLYKLVNIDFDDKTSFATVKYMLIFPFSFFLGIVYTESLFIMLSIMCFYYLRKNNWKLAGIFGFLSAVTKNQGVILFAPAVIEIIISLNIPSIHYALQNKKKFFIEFLKKFVCIIPIPLGFGTYLTLNKVITGNWFKFLEYQSSNWNHNFNLIHNTLEYHFSYMLNPSYSGLYRISIWIPQFVLFLLVILLIIYGLKRIRGSYLLYMFLYTFVIYSTTWLISGGRYILCLFPIYILISLMSQRNRYIDFIFTFTSLVFLGYYTLNFLQGGVL
jgi:Gpi18-like mannosyltransferase